MNDHDIWTASRLGVRVSLPDARTKQDSAQPDTASLPLAVVVMEFPAPSETFVSRRVRLLSEMGTTVEVFSMRPANRKTDDLVRTRDLGGISRSNLSLVSLARGLLVAAINPALTLRLGSWLINATWRKPGTLARSLLLAPRALDIFLQLQRRPPFVVHAEWGHYPSMVLWLVQKRMPQVTTSISLNAYDLEMEYGGSIEVTRRADVVRTLTRANVSHIAQFTGVEPQRIQVIYDGVDVASVESAMLGTTKTPGRVVTISRLSFEKRVDLAIRAFAKCAAESDCLELRVFGDGPERGRLRRLVEELGLGGKVTFFGHVEHGRIVTELAQAQALLLMSESERLPNVVKEGMAARCVCITTESVGIEELVEHGVTGFVVDQGDITAAANSLSWALLDRSGAETMGKLAHRHVTTKFDLRANNERFMDLWRARRHAG